MSKALELLPTVFFLLNLGFSENFSIRGYIKNKMTNKPIKNVSVYLKDLRLGTTTDENGYFYFRLNKNFDSISLEFSHIAYETVRWRGATQDVMHIKMKETLLKLDEIVITGTKSEFSSSDVPVFIELINNKEIRSSSATTVGELIEERAGVSKIYNFDGSFNYSLIGLDSKYILILKDGQPITGKFNDKVDLDQITTANIEKIEILKGPGSALYGTEAMGGVINIITKDSNSSVHSEFKVKGTNYKGNLKNIATNPIGSDVSYSFSVPFSTFKIYSTLVIQKLVNGKKISSLGKDEIDKLNFDGGVLWRSENESHNVKLGLNYFERADSSKEKTITGLVVKSNSTSIVRNNSIFEYKFIPHDKFNFTQNINLNNYFREYNQIGISETYKKDDETIESLIDYESKVSYSNEKLNLIGGLELSKPTYKSNRLYGGSHNRSTWGQFFQVGYILSKMYTFIGGLRFDNYENTIVTSPRIAFLVKPTSGSKIRFSYGEGFRIPSFLEMYIDFNNIENGYTVMGNDNLNPEKSKGMTINYEYTNNQSIRFHALSYFNHFSNKIETQYQESDNLYQPIIYRYENIAKADYRGVEFSISFLKSSKTSIKMNFNAREAIDGDGRDLPNTIPYSFGSQLNYNFSKYATRITINSSSNYRIDDQLYHLLNIRLNYNINQKLSTNIGVKNIMDYTNNTYGPFTGRSIYFEIVKL
tara:strand:+ start:622 stop:2730 length:2109 start_codon:yes stop_codon:yes gene_type:complete